MFSTYFFIYSQSQKLISYRLHAHSEWKHRSHWSPSRFCIHSFRLPQDNAVVLVIADALSAGSNSLFEILNRIRECGASPLINFSSSSISTNESDQRGPKEQLSVLLAVLFPSEFPRYRAIDWIYTNSVLIPLFSNIDGRRRTATDPINLTVHSGAIIHIETPKEEKYNSHRERSFFSKLARNQDQILAEYTTLINKDYLTGRWYAPEDIIIVAPPAFSLHISDCILRMA